MTTPHNLLAQTAQQNIHDIVTQVFLHTSAQRAVVIYDTDSELSVLLTQAYRVNVPEAIFIDFNQTSPEAVLATLAPLSAGDFVVLIQSTSFRLDAYRIRVELFKRGLKVIEHIHLSRMPNQQVAYYIDSLAYDASYYRGVGHALKAKIDAAPHGRIESGSQNGAAGDVLYYNSPFESAKLNIGDYTGMTNMGGQFPLGEVFTEAQELTAVSGRARIFIFGDTQFRINRPEHPITLIIQAGQVTGVEHSTPEFDTVLNKIRQDEGVVWVRELGFGMNRAFTQTRTVDDIGTYERMCGIHLSLGAKHGIYGKPGFKRGDGKYHVDVFVDTHSVVLGEEEVYRDGAWVV